MTQAHDERQRRWRARIDVASGRTQIDPVDKDPRMSPASSRLLEALNRSDHSRPEHHDTDPPPEESEPVPPALPLNPWRNRGEPGLAQPQDADRRGYPTVAAPLPAVEPPLSPPRPEIGFGILCEHAAELVLGKLRPILGLPPSDPGAIPSQHEGAYTVLNPAGAFVTVNPDDVVSDATGIDGWADATPEISPAGSFVQEPG